MDLVIAVPFGAVPMGGAKSFGRGSGCGSVRLCSLRCGGAGVYLLSYRALSAIYYLFHSPQIAMRTSTSVYFPVNPTHLSQSAHARL